MERRSVLAMGALAFMPIPRLGDSPMPVRTLEDARESLTYTRAAIMRGVPARTVFHSAFEGYAVAEKVVQKGKQRDHKEALAVMGQTSALLSAMALNAGRPDMSRSWAAQGRECSLGAGDLTGQMRAHIRDAITGIVTNDPGGAMRAAMNGITDATEHPEIPHHYRAQLTALAMEAAAHAGDREGWEYWRTWALAERERLDDGGVESYVFRPQQMNASLAASAAQIKDPAALEYASLALEAYDKNNLYDIRLARLTLARARVNAGQIPEGAWEAANVLSMAPPDAVYVQKARLVMSSIPAEHHSPEMGLLAEQIRLRTT